MRMLPSWIAGVLLALLFAGALPLVSGCENEGPMEELGEDIDDAVDEAEDEIE